MRAHPGSRHARGRARPHDRGRTSRSRPPRRRAGAHRRLAVAEVRSFDRTPPRVALAGAHGSRTHRATPNAAPSVLKTKPGTGPNTLPAHRSDARVQASPSVVPGNLRRAARAFALRIAWSAGYHSIPGSPSATGAARASSTADIGAM